MLKICTIFLFLFLCFCFPLYADGVLYVNPSDEISNVLNVDESGHQVITLQYVILGIMNEIEAGTYNIIDMFDLNDFTSRILYDSDTGCVLYDSDTGCILYDSIR